MKKCTYLRIAWNSAYVLHRHLRKKNMPLWRRLRAIEQRQQHRERVATCNARSWLTDGDHPATV